LKLFSVAESLKLANSNKNCLFSAGGGVKDPSNNTNLSRLLDQCV